MQQQHKKFCHLLMILVNLASCLPVRGFFLQSLSPVKSNSLLPSLEALIEESKSGVDLDRLDEIKELMIEISETRKGDQRKSLPGQWELIFTTEKEVNFFKTSWPFAKVASITQEIDPYGTNCVDNSINFEGGGEFAVTGKVVPVDSDSEYDRIEFEFTSAIAKVWGKELNLPPVGTGWFDTMFCEGNYRLSRDNRGDWSVFRRR